MFKKSTKDPQFSGRFLFLRFETLSKYSAYPFRGVTNLAVVYDDICIWVSMCNYFFHCPIFSLLVLLMTTRTFSFTCCFNIRIMQNSWCLLFFFQTCIQTNKINENSSAAVAKITNSCSLTLWPIDRNFSKKNPHTCIIH